MRTALVTAGSRGLGRALVTHLAESGHRVFTTYHSSRSEAEALETRYPGRVRCFGVDLERAEDRSRLAASVQAECERLDVLVNNLGVYPEAHLQNIDLELWRRVFELTCTAGFHLTRLLEPVLEASGRARVINIGDSGADRIEARAQATPYHIAKLGVHVLTRTNAQLLGPRGITVNMVSPGFLANSVGEPGEPVPLGRLGEFEDILGAVDYLLSDAARYVSGTNLLVAGGWNLG